MQDGPEGGGQEGRAHTAKGPHTLGRLSGPSRLPDDRGRLRWLRVLSSACQAPEEEKGRVRAQLCWWFLAGWAHLALRVRVRMRGGRPQVLPCSLWSGLALRVAASVCCEVCLERPS